MRGSRRSFLKKIGGAASAVVFPSIWLPSHAAGLEESIQNAQHDSPAHAAEDEDFWAWVQSSYTTSPTIINLNNGGVSPQPQIVQDAHNRYYTLANEAPSLYMWRYLDKGREPLRSQLALLAGCSPEEIAINRNTTEALETILYGIPLEAGDEVVLTKQDYPHMIDAWEQRAKREGIVLKYINLELPLERDEEIVELFTSAFTKKTKVVHVTHMINWTGQILPAKKIAAMAHERNIEVVLDGAHTFAHIDFNLKDLDCDYFGTSLHKWLCAPFGSGFLYVKKEKIKNLWPLFAAKEHDSNDIRKFEHLGTRSFAIEQAVGVAIRFHNSIGIERKEARLRYLKNYWAEKVVDFPGVNLHTSFKDEYACAIANFSIDGREPQAVGARLQSEFGIHTTSINRENIHGVRVTPHVYTTLQDLDRLVSAIKRIAGN